MTEIKKRPVGAPRLGETARIKRSIMIDEADMAIILRLGNGNQSAGVHALVDLFKTSHLINLAPTGKLSPNEFIKKADVFNNAVLTHLIQHI
jgi:hypothetical protein